jgi:hypothetical protein
VSPTGVIFSYAIGLIFAVGGIAFLVGLEDNRLLFGIPYLIIGVVIIGGVMASQRRMKRKGASGRGHGGEEPPSRSPY